MPRPRDWTHSLRRDIAVGLAIGTAIALIAVTAWHLAHAWLT